MISLSKLLRLFISLAGVFAFGVGVRWALANSSAAPATQDEAALWAAVGGLDAQFFKSAAAPSTHTSSARISVSQRPIASVPITFTPVATIYLPLISASNPITQEVRALWVTRFEWTSSSHAVTTTDLDAIVDNAAAAHFNLLLFQIRGTADAFYPSTLEPWSARMTGSLTQTLGVDPGWDPLAYMIARAHANGMQVHAYMNMYPTWICGYGAPPHTTPEHLFWTLSYSTAWNTWRVWDNTYTAMNLATCGSYLWATPALSLTNQHIVAVSVDLATRYDIDGIHLDNVRYPGSNYSFDPFTQQAFTNVLSISPSLTFAAWQPDFQRAQVNNLVAQIYSATTAIRPDLWVSAAVWPFYSGGYNSYFQDSKGWLAAGSVDANMPMLYATSLVTDVAAWTATAQDFINAAHGRYVIPGIGVLDSNNACVSFDQLQARIDAARAMGAPGVVFFSYSSLASCGYLNSLASGPFATSAVVPKPAWKP